MNQYERAVISARPEPDSDRRWLYRLTCGHEVSRRQDGAKRRCHCGYCEALGDIAA